MKLKYKILILAGFSALGIFSWQISLKPMQNRDWAEDQKILARAEMHDNLITIHNIRNFTYRSESDYTPGYYDKTFDLKKIKQAYYSVVPFGGIPGIAHTFMSFEFENENFIAISIEVRKQKGQSFSAWKSAFRTYELMYVVADERDVVKLRTNYRQGENVYFYPVKADKEALQGIFMDYMRQVNVLHEKPKFYNLFANTCTTDIVDIVNRSTKYRIPWSYKYYLPGFSDSYALEQDLLNTNLAIDDARKKFYINEIAKKYANDPDFSLRIRGR